MTKVRDIMTADAQWLAPTATIQQAAQLMKDKDVGCVPVGKDDRLVGMVTDRDIAVRAVASGMNCQSAGVGSIMSEKLLYCREDDDVDDVAVNMAEQSVRRLPVVNDDKRLVGMVSLGDIAARGSAHAAGDALGAVAAH